MNRFAQKQAGILPADLQYDDGNDYFPISFLNSSWIYRRHSAVVFFIVITSFHLLMIRISWLCVPAGSIPLTMYSYSDNRCFSASIRHMTSHGL